jgi:hypothetical protein
MSGRSHPARGRSAPARGALATPHATDIELLAWLLFVAFGLLLLAAILLLGPSLGHALYPSLDAARLWTWNRSAVAPESSEQADYLLALVAAAGLAVAIAALTRSTGRLGARAAHAGSLSRLVLATLIVASVVGHDRLPYGPAEAGLRGRYFAPGTWLAAVGVAAILALAIRVAALRGRLPSTLRERPRTRSLATALAFAVTAAALMACIDTDATIVTHRGVQTIIAYVMDEAFAVVNGLTPFVDFQPLYATLWPFVVAIPLTAIAPTLLVFTATMYVLSVTALLAVFGVLRRATRSSLGALLLYVPFLATSLYLDQYSSLRAAYSAGSYFPAFPLRYAGPYMLAWLTSRALTPDRRGSRRLLFIAGGLVVLNNANFGVPALLGTIAAILCTSGPLRRPVLIRLARDLASGLVTAAALVCALTLVRAGALPDLTQLLDYASFFVGGYAGIAIPSHLGLHVILYLTFAGALATAAVRAVQDAPNRVLTGMLAWSGLFGLGAGSYFVAESDPFHLRMVFSAWALSISLLAVPVVQRLAARPRRLPTLADAAVLVGVGIMVCSLAQLSRPWMQIDRLRNVAVGRPVAEPLAPDPAQRSFIASLAYGRHDFYVARGAPVVLLLENGHRLAAAFGVRDVNPYTDIYTMLGPTFLRRAVATLRHEGGNTVILPLDSPATEEVGEALARWGFARLTTTGVGNDPGATPVTMTVSSRPIAKWVDQRNLRPAALRGDRSQPVVSYPGGG